MGKRIFYVDDQPETALVEILEMGGHQIVATATSREEAIEVGQRIGFDVALVDSRMSKEGGDGLAIYEALKDRGIIIAYTTEREPDYGDHHIRKADLSGFEIAEFIDSL